MTRHSKVFVAIGVFVATAAMTASSAAAGLPQPDKAKTGAHVIQIRRANVGLPPVVGGPYGDPSDFPGASSSVIQSDSSSGKSDAASGDDCLHQIVQPLSAC